MRGRGARSAVLAAVLATGLLACGGDPADGPGARTDTTSRAASSPPVGSASGARDTARSEDPRRTDVFRCTDSSGASFRFELRPRDGRVAVWLPERFARESLVLERVRSDSGARYEGNGAVVRDRGDEALLRVGGRTYRGCTRDRGGWVWAEARRRGVDFRASGDEPGWYLELTRGDSLYLAYDYGTGELTLPAPEPELEEGPTRIAFRSETSGTTLEVVIADEPCVAMSGTEFPATVTVRLDGTTYRGCGRWLGGAPFDP